MVGVKLRVGSLFSGIGGLEYGLERAGLVTSHEWMIEMDEYCCTVLRKNFKNSLIICDKVENINPRDLPEIDILTAGFPCQPVSVAGQQKGLSDERWLWDEVWRFINDLRPRYFLLENVPGLFTANKGEAINRVLKDIAESRLYRFEWQIISARSVGAAHLRKRFFGVGTLGDTKHNGSSTSENRDGLQKSSTSRGLDKEHEEDFDWKLERKSQGDRELANSIDSRQRTRGPGNKREGQEESKERRREQITKSGRQGSSSILVNTESKSSKQTNQSAKSKRKKQKTRLDSRDGHRGTQQKTNRSEAELWMGVETHGIPRWMARLGFVNVWRHSAPNLPTPTSRDWKDTYGTVETGSNASKRNTLPLAIFRQIRDEEFEGYEAWEYGMPRSRDDYPGRVDKLKALGNAVVPECAELVGRLIKRADELGTMVFDLSLLDQDE